MVTKLIDCALSLSFCLSLSLRVLCILLSYVSQCHVLQTLTTLEDKCDFDAQGNVSFEAEFEPLLFEIVKLIDTDGDNIVTQKETVAALRRYREGVEISYKNARIDGDDAEPASTAAAVCPTYTESPGMDLFS